KEELLQKNADCGNCERFFKDCGGGCRASALTETGDLIAKDPVACDLVRKGYRDRFASLAASARSPRKSVRTPRPRRTPSGAARAKNVKHAG
ncbi:MAG: hypothetical protein NT031_19270, partial [Planctomycetota bacterium]|nr:hypothetical protein [Planctomycetota bacterium]